MMRKSILILLPLALLAAGCSPSGPAPKRGAQPAPSRENVAVAKGVIDAETGLIRVLAPRDGVVGRTLVEEGDHVAADQPLALIDDRQARLGLDAAAAELGDRRAQLEVAAAKAAGAEREAGRLARLAAADAATRQEAEQAATTAAVARGEQRQAREALRAAEAKRRLDAFEVAARTVRAPVAGMIVRRTVAPGAFVSAAAPLYLLEPDGRRIVRAELDDTFADRVRPGMIASVTREFRQGRPYKARVLRVSHLLSAPSLAEDPTAKADTRVVSVVLALDEAPDLRLGQRVLVRFNP